MREDMSKVIVERPRWGSSLPSRKKGYHKYLQKHADDLPQREPMPGRWRGRQRSLNENLGPMKRFLRSNVGRPWNKVHQELCEHISFNNAVQSHVLDHIYDFVDRHVEWVDGVLYAQRSWGGSRIRVQSGCMYICPETGLLKILKRSRRQWMPTRVGGNGTTVNLSRGNDWYEIRLQALPADGDQRWDVWQDRLVTFNDFQACADLYGSKSFAVSMRKLTREERKALLKRINQKRKKKRKSRDYSVRRC